MTVHTNVRIATIGGSQPTKADAVVVTATASTKGFIDSVSTDILTTPICYYYAASSSSSSTASTVAQGIPEPDVGLDCSSI